jgi:undecaprenyl-diphosphatase
MTRILFIILIYTTTIFAFIIDHKVQKDESLFWASHYNIPKYTFIANIALASYEGSDNRLGKTAWKSLDAGIISQIITEGFKRGTGRLRPRESDSSNSWNEDGKSFVSGHVSGMTAIVTPYILEYKEDYPLIYLLWFLPIHQMIGRVKAQAHWQSDVIGGAIVGYTSGYLSYNMKTPMLLYFSKDKAYVGLKYSF